MNESLIIYLRSDAEGHIAISLPYLGMIQVGAVFRYININFSILFTIRFTIEVCANELKTPEVLIANPFNNKN